MFVFKDLDILSDNEIDLVIKKKIEGDDQLGYVPSYHYLVKESGKELVIGQIDIRIGHNPNTYYGGNIGYGIDEDYRGNRYASKAVKLVLELARAHGMDKVIITCDPDNIASRKTAEAAGARLIEIADLPEDNDMYKDGARQKCIFELYV